MSGYKQRVIVMLVAIFCIFLCVGDAAAQTSPEPIILSIEGDLRSWGSTDQTLMQLTQSGYIGIPVISPDGTRVAFSAAPATYADWVQAVGGAGGFTPPQNISILDLPSGYIYLVAEQGVDAVWDGPEHPGKYILRSTSTWSPDGQQLAWMEFKIDTISATSDQENGLAELLVYDLVSKLRDDFNNTRN